MLSYYGSKSRLVNLYPAPKHDKIIEPFAGSAQYALKYFEKEVLLVDKYETIIRIWKYLQQCSPADILGLPKLTKGADLRTMGLSEDERLFLGIMAGAGNVRPRHTVSAFASEQHGRKNKMQRIADNLFKIKHWEIKCGCYLEIPNEKATWFIDPPYQEGGHTYKHGNKNFDYPLLSVWSQSRHGQVILCENSKATWMDFQPISRSRGVNMKHTIESVYLQG